MIGGNPKEIQIDNGRKFVNRILDEFLQSIGIEHALGSLSHPQSQGNGEAFN